MTATLQEAHASLGPFPWSLGPQEIRRTAARVLEGARVDLERLLRNAGAATVDSVLRPLDRILLEARMVSSHGGFLFQVHPDPETRAAGREVSEAADRFLNALRGNAALYARVGAVPLEDLDPVSRFAREKLLREMRRSGVELDPAGREEILSLNNQIDETSNQFSANIAALDRSFSVPADALGGLPPDFTEHHAPGSDGRIHLTTKYPDFKPVVAYADRADVRRKMLEEFLDRAYPENLPVLDQLLGQRDALARRLGFRAYADYALEDKMLQRPDAVRQLIDRVTRLARPPAHVAEARILARKQRDEPTATRLEMWDASFYSQGYYDGKIRVEEYGVDLKALRAYLPYAQVRDGLFGLCADLFDLRFDRRSSTDLWHPSVEAYDVFEDGRPMGRIYLDLVPRPGKYTHAACFGIRDGIRGVQLPQNALVCNFVDPTAAPDAARMEYTDVVTFFHEFGHLLHALFSGQGPWVYTTMGSIEWDFVEAPSQLFEEWARDPRTLARFARNPDTGEALPRDLLERLEAAERFGRPGFWLRQVALAAISLEMYDRRPEGLDTTALFREVGNRYFPIPFEGDFHPQAAWGHLTGYSAFYYTYVWSVVLARDLLSPFHARGDLTDPEMARRYANEILRPGSTRPATELVHRFLERDFSYDAFEAWVRGERRGAG